MKRYYLLLAWLMAALTALADSVERVDVDVTLRPDGSARVQEQWRINVTSNITEWYLVMGNMGSMQLRNFGVSEDGTAFTNEGAWDIDRSRAAKRQRCGIVTKRDGLELCWGIGSGGAHRFNVAYTLDGLVKGYPDADGFNHMFVARGLDPSPDNVTLTIRLDSDTAAIDSLNTQFWAFGFRGDIQLADSAIVAATSEPFSRRSAMIVMAQFEKGLFHPAQQGEGRFEDVRQRAMDGSDYDSGDGPSLWMALVVAFISLGSMIGLPFVVYYAGFYLTLMPLWRYLRRRKLGVGKQLLYVHEAPKDISLRRAHSVVNSLRYTPGTEKLSNIISAYLVRLITHGHISVEGDLLRIHPEKPLEKTSAKVNDEYFESAIYNMLSEAAGDDHLLQRNELKKWSAKRGQVEKDLHSFYATLKNSKATKDDMEKAPEIFGLRKFLKDFTLLDERHVQETALWDELMVWAELFGISKQVRRDLKKVAPDYFKLSAAAQMIDERMGTDDTWITLWAANINSRASHAYAHRETALARQQASRSGGHGGSASWGGGGGFSGGGFGGGGR